MLSHASEAESVAAEYARVVAERDALQKELQRAKAAHAKLLENYRALQTELELSKRRLFVAKAERVDTAQLELEFVKLSAKLAALEAELPGGEPSVPPTLNTDRPAGPTPSRPRPKPLGRRDLDLLDLPEERVVITDDAMEALVEAGKATRTGFEESSKLAWQRGGQRRLVIARVTYGAKNVHGEIEREVAAVPPELLPRCLAAPSLLAQVVVDKFCDGLPLNRIEERFGREGVGIDRGTLSRWVDGVAKGLGPVVDAMMKDALANAFCIATDATGLSIQPVRDPKAPRRPCRKGTFFTLVADADHVLFKYMERETSSAVSAMLKGFKGYVQADAKAVYDAFFNAQKDAKDAPEAGPEVGCWAHARRKFWEAASCKDPGGLEGLYRIRRLFQLDDTWKDRPPADRHKLRLERLKPELDAFFVWATAEYRRLQSVRGKARSAFGYAVRQQSALSAFLADGRLKLDNNGAERALRPTRVGQKAWLFVGSDDHAASAAILFSLIASARLHRLDPVAYVRDLIRVTPHWPEDRYLELAPLYWTTTRALLDGRQLAAECGTLDVPPARALRAPVDRSSTLSTSEERPAQ